MLAPPAPDVLAARRAARMFRLSVGTYFMGGVVVTLVSLLAPRLRLLMGLGYAQASLVQLAFHSSYLLFALPITAALVRVGYMRGMAAGLAVMVLGCLGFAGAAAAGSFAAVLLALLALAAGVTFLQVAGALAVALVEPAERAAPRMTLLQGFNSVGTVLAPLAAASFLLGRGSGPGSLAAPFLLSALVLAGAALAFWRARDLLAGLAPPRRVPVRELGRVLGERRLVAGTAAMFAYVGAEVTIGTMLPAFLAQRAVLGASPEAAGRLVSLYWAGAMAGRFAGAALLTRWPAPRVLAAFAGAAVLLTATAAGTGGAAGAAALLAVGLANSVMYPTVFALSLPDDEGAAPYASMALCMAVVGGAVVPVLTGALADRAGPGLSLLLPAACYGGIVVFALARGEAAFALGRGRTA